MNHSPQYTKIAGSVLLIVLALTASVIIGPDLIDSQSPNSHDLSMVIPPTSGEPAYGLPGRHTTTPDDSTPFMLPTAPLTPQVTSPFNFPTSLPVLIPTSFIECSDIFPLDSIESIKLGVTTITQLEASLGRAKYQSGRAPRFRFEEGNCVLIVTVGVDEALDLELPYYGSLDELLTRYGEPGAIGVSQGNLTLLNIGNAVLLYPSAGIIAIFDVGPDDLMPDSPITSLQFHLPYDTEKQVQRLNLHLVDHGMAPELLQPLPR